jgi:hypothetical protein
MKKTAAFWHKERWILTCFWELFFYIFVVDKRNLYCNIYAFISLSVLLVFTIDLIMWKWWQLTELIFFLFPTLSNLHFIVNPRWIVACVRAPWKMRGKEKNKWYIYTAYKKCVNMCSILFFYLSLFSSLLFSSDDFVIIVGLPFSLFHSRFIILSSSSI